MNNNLKSIRFYLSGVALGLGIIGVLFFAIGIPITIFGAHFFAGMGFREGPQPTAEQIRMIVNRNVWWSIWHRLVPLLMLSLALISYGFYEARNEQKAKQ